MSELAVGTEQSSAKERARLAQAPVLLDLAVTVLVAALAATVVLLPGPPLLRVPLGILLVLFLPGYGVVSALFPSNDGPDGVARFALSVAMSLSAIPLVALVIESTPWRMDRTSLATGLTAVTGLTCIAAVFLRLRLPDTEQYIISAPKVDLPGPSGWSRQDWLIASGLALAVVLFVAGGFDTFKARIFGVPTTEFALYNAEGKAQFYPRDIVIGEGTVVQIGITNHEGKPIRYRLVVGGAGRAVGTLSEEEIADGETWQKPVEFTVDASGERMPVYFDLYRVGEESSEPYRTLTLIVNGVTAEDSS
jgi:uncharacterized membrane protein